MREMQVERPPECDQLRPRRVLILLKPDPRVLIVAGKYEVILELCAHEPLMVIGCRIDEMTDDLARRPLAWGARTRARVVGESEQRWRGVFDNQSELFYVARHISLVLVGSLTFSRHAG